MRMLGWRRAWAVPIAVLACVTSALANACVDVHERECFLWANIGECEHNPFVAQRCRPSCGTCEPSHEVNQSVPQVVVISPGAPTAHLPFALEGDETITAVEAGELHLVMLTSSGRVLTFGDDSMGQLGQPRVARRVPLTRRAPGRVVWPAPHTNSRAVAVRAGRFSSGALLESGVLLLWGENTHGQSGVLPEATPLDAAPAELSALQAIVAVPVVVPLAARVSAFSLGEVHSLLLTTSGHVYALRGSQPHGGARTRLAGALRRAAAWYSATDARGFEPRTAGTRSATAPLARCATAQRRTRWCRGRLLRSGRVRCRCATGSSRST
jgi:hypothetical protein